jgi:hypothetical protein
MRVDLVERLPEHGAATGEAAEDTSVKLALQNFQSAMQGDDSIFVREYRGNWQVNRAGEGRGICSGNVSLSFKENVSLSFKEKEFGRNRGLYFQLIQKLIELLKGAGSQEVLMARLCLVSAGKDESSPVFFLWGLNSKLWAITAIKPPCAGGWAWHICSKRCYSPPAICGK